MLEITPEPPLVPAKFYHRPALEVARALLGKILVRRGPGRALRSGRIVEVEAYMGQDDPASHAFRGPTPRTQVMFEEGGQAYVYFTYGAHHCVNVVTGTAGTASAVLIRALEPLAGLELMKKRRGQSAPHELLSGPGKLCQALDIDRSFNRYRFYEAQSPLQIWDSAERPGPVLSGPRIGISRAQDLAYRFYLERKLEWVSGRKRALT